MASARVEKLLRRYLESLAAELARDDIVDQLLGDDEIDSENAFIYLVERHRRMAPRICRATLDRYPDAGDAFQAADGAVYAEVVPPELVTRTMQLVRRLKARSASPESTLSSGQVATNFLFPKNRRVTIDTLRKTPRFSFSQCRGTPD